MLNGSRWMSGSDLMACSASRDRPETPSEDTHRAGSSPCLSRRPCPTAVPARAVISSWGSGSHSCPPQASLSPYGSTEQPPVGSWEAKRNLPSRTQTPSWWLFQPFPWLPALAHGSSSGKKMKGARGPRAGFKKSTQAPPLLPNPLQKLFSSLQKAPGGDITCLCLFLCVCSYTYTHAHAHTDEDWLCQDNAIFNLLLKVRFRYHRCQQHSFVSQQRNSSHIRRGFSRRQALGAIAF